jgi:hypothetical protein
MKLFITVITSKGSNNYEIAPEDGVTFIKDYLAKHTGWIYLDGNVTNPDMLNTALLQQAGTITITNQIIGG